VYLKPFRAVILETACRYLYYKWQNEGSTTEIPEFVIEPELALETLMAADFLDCKFWLGCCFYATVS
jgi:transcription elongation factor B subunit 1